VTDIGCSGLFDTFFNTHAMHGLHGRALTYATGLKLARPELTVITIMGDGGLGIGGAHVLAGCRRNLDITLLVLNNFNYGMTGGQCSATSPAEAVTSSGFLNALEPPLDLHRLAVAAGAPWVQRASTTDAALVDMLAAALTYDGFSLLEIQGLCTGRYTKRNPGARAFLERNLSPSGGEVAGRIAANERPEYGEQYRRLAHQQGVAQPVTVIPVRHPAPAVQRAEILILGAAGQRIHTAGEILCLAAMTAGMQASQKNDYPITVLRGHSVSEIILSRDVIHFTGIEKPDFILALSAEGVARKKAAFALAGPGGLVVKASDVEIPATSARVLELDFKGSYRIPPVHRALGALAVLCAETPLATIAMLRDALAVRFTGRNLDESLEIVNRAALPD
jgi:Pyruvate/2-oxoacid:ferredoxin oxidoreductase gamma subunit